MPPLSSFAGGSTAGTLPPLGSFVGGTTPNTPSTPSDSFLSMSKGGTPPTNAFSPSSISSFVSGAFGALTSSEQGVGGEIAAGADTGSGALPYEVHAGPSAQDMLNQANQSNAASDTNYIQAMHAKNAAGTPLTPTQQAVLNHITQNSSSVGTQTDLFPHAADTNLQALGNVGGVAADVLTAGSYGAEARGADSFARMAAAPVEQAGKQTLAQIAKQTTARSLIGGGVGYGYDVTNNLQNGATGADALMPGAATIAGATIPALIGGVRVGVAVSKDQAPRFINSLIKPKAADFSYGKDPGRTVSELGITGNSLTDFQNNITAAKQGIGQQLGAIYSNPANAGVRINANPEIAKIDAAMEQAAKGGKQNQAVVTQLSNIKDALLYEHGIGADGTIVKTGDVPRDLSDLSPQEAQSLIQQVSQQTRFTGNPSDDKTVNSVLKNIYGGIREKINAGVSVNNPEVEHLNQQYADLTSAELATANRDKIVQRSNMVSMPIKAGGTAGIVAAIATGGMAIPAALAAGGAYAVDKALESTAVKTRIAAWLGDQSANKLSQFFADNPKLAPVLTRVFPAIVGKISGQAGQLLSPQSNQ